MLDGDVVAMKDAEFQGLASSDPRLAAYAASRQPAWLWTADGRQILWANPAGARAFGAANAAALAEKTFGPADRHRCGKVAADHGSGGRRSRVNRRWFAGDRDRLADGADLQC